MAYLPPNKFSELWKGGGANRDRTDDLYNAIVALSQLSYGPLTMPPYRVLVLYRQPAADARKI